MAKQILSYIYMFYNIIKKFVELFPYFVSCILCSTLFFFIIKIFMPPMDEYPGSTTVCRYVMCLFSPKTRKQEACV
jgi:hypothetical protein